MSARYYDLPTYLRRCARKQGVTMTELAKLCGFSRTTLYRYLRGDITLDETDIALFSEALHLTGEEEKNLRSLANGERRDPAGAEAYALLNQILFQAPEAATEPGMTFAYYAEGEKYLRTGRELCETIETECGTGNEAEIRVSATNCTGGTMFPFLRLLMTGLFAASPFVSMEHLVAFPEDDNCSVASTLSQVLSLLHYDGYHALYSSAPGLMAREEEATHDTIRIRIQRPSVKNNPPAVYYALTLYANGLSQCIRYTDRTLDAFFNAHYDHAKAGYQDTLLYSRNLQAFNQELAEFEAEGSVCLFKPDPCYNDVPPEAYRDLLGRMTDSEKGEMLKLLSGQSVARSEIKATIEGFLSTMEQRYQSAGSHPYRLICCQEGLVNFAKTGLLTANVGNFPPFSMPERALILQSLYDRISASEENLSVLILPDRMLADGTIISVNRDKGLLIDFGGVRQQGYSQNVLLHCPALSKLMADYAYGEALTKRAYSQDAALRLIGELLSGTKK